MIDTCLCTVALLTHSTNHVDPLEAALAYHSTVTVTVQQVEDEEALAAEAAKKAAELARIAAAERADRAAARAATSTAPVTGSLPSLLLTIRANESGGNYQAYNATGCLGGCYGAYQMTGEYMDTWAIEAGYPDYAYAGFWPAEVQDAVALYKFNQTGGALWCDWTDYC
jgi:hypothetical protein